jgi:MYXO-CTERM domain-containing protein
MDARQNAAVGRRTPRLAGIVAGTVLAFGLASLANAAEVTYTFTLTGAAGSLAGSAFTDATVSWSLIANTEDVQPGSPRGFNVRPLAGAVFVGDEASDMTAALVANSAVWTYTSDGEGLRIGFGTWEPFESFTSGSYDGPLGWNMQTSFSGGAVGTESILRAISNDGIATDAGLLLVSGYSTASFSASVVPAPGVFAVLAVAGFASRRRR